MTKRDPANHVKTRSTHALLHRSLLPNYSRSSVGVFFRHEFHRPDNYHLSRRAFLWPEQAADVLAAGRSLTELAGVGPYLENLIRGWLQDPPPVPESSDLRKGFLTIPEARAILHLAPSWSAALRGDLQMHTVWSDGSASISEMAEAAAQRGYEYIAITDHAQSLRIAGGIDERQLQEQGAEIAEIADIPVGTVMSRLYRARRRLQKSLYEFALESGIITEVAADGQL